MPKRPLAWKFAGPFAIAALLAALLLGWLALSRSDQLLVQTNADYLAALARFLDSRIGPDIGADRGELAAFCGDFAQQFDGLRIVLLAPDGAVELDTRNRPADLDDALARPEIAQAASGQSEHMVRYHAALEYRVLYLASPVFWESGMVGILYLSKPLREADERLAQLRTQWIAGGLAVIAGSALLAWWAARAVAASLDPVRVVAGRLADGQWQARVTLADSRELALVGEDFNRLADRLQQRLSVLTQNNNEQKAVLASMAEGVVAVDRHERIISMNSACGRLLGLDPAQAQGRRLQEVVRNADLSRFITRALTCDDPIEDDVLLHGNRPRVMQAHGSALHDLEGRAIGAVVVLNDVTDFRRLEQIRRDFVANVSHELKTPVTSIKGFAETLLDGALTNSEDAERFLRIIAKQADRLHAIIEDLLSLSKIEQSEDDEDIVLEMQPIRGVLQAAVAACQVAASERSIAVALDCPEDLAARVNPVLLEQCVVNLLDNAIKYSGDGSEVRLAARPENGQVAIRVSDHGCGIASEHLERIFERFYRVDPARSRKLGGTGLGLAIVKHIVQAHRGQISVESELGVGSTFTIRLPGA